MKGLSPGSWLSTEAAELVRSGAWPWIPDSEGGGASRWRREKQGLSLLPFSAWCHRLPVALEHRRPRLSGPSRASTCRLPGLDSCPEAPGKGSDFKGRKRGDTSFCPMLAVTGDLEGRRRPEKSPAKRVW